VFCVYIVLWTVYGLFVCVCVVCTLSVWFVCVVYVVCGLCFCVWYVYDVCILCLCIGCLFDCVLFDKLRVCVCFVRFFFVFFVSFIYQYDLLLMSNYTYIFLKFSYYDLSCLHTFYNIH